MTINKQPDETIDWSLTTWDGARREALRRWSELPLERIIAALEEMQELNGLLASPSVTSEPTSQQATDTSDRIHEQHAEYSDVTDTSPLLDLAGDRVNRIGDMRSLLDSADTDLAALDEQALIARLREHGDRVPRNLIDACAYRGDTLVQILGDLLDDPHFWDDIASDGEWWLRLHTAMILGLIPGEHAGRRLIDLMRRLDEADDSNTQDWLAGKWPALFANKPTTLSEALHALVEDRSRDGYIRINAAETCIALAMRISEAALDATLDWAAGLITPAQGDRYMQLSLGNLLLDFPRARHRDLLDDLAASQTGFGIYFDADNVKQAFERGHDKPDWERFKDLWAFYHPEAIAARQQRWADEALHQTEHDYFDDEAIDPVWHEPYVRQEPKIGRNDPCPCGSGKKYKKCCGLTR